METQTALWLPQSEPQWRALLSRADELFYGGAAGGGKTDLILGLAIDCHKHAQIFRRVYPNLSSVMRRAREIIKDGAKENKADKVWNWQDGKTLEFGAVQYESDKTNWQGRAADLKAFDEVTEFTESQYDFISGWNRTTDPGQRVRVIATGNPPIDESGSWVTRRWGAWLDKKYHHPARDGEVRWYAKIDNRDQEVENGEPFEHKGETIYPRSRTFIRALVDDNPFYAQDGRYLSVLQNLPEPLRSMFRWGDFEATAAANPFQIIPTDWVLAAQKRWMERDKPDVPLISVGIDCVRGGNDNMTLSRRYDNWFAEVQSWPGVLVPDGKTAATLIHSELGNERPREINVDVIGVGSSTYDHLDPLYDDVRPVNASEASGYRDKSGKLKMRNVRAEYHWRMRDALDPIDGDDVALPNDPELLADLCAPRYKITTSGVLVEEKEAIKARIGRSPDKGEAVMLCNYTTGVWDVY